MAKKSARKSSAAAKPYTVFVSHATADKWLATVICEKIEAIGATTFRDDRDIDGGDDIPDKIFDAIRKSNEMMVLLTPESIGSGWVLLEVGAALFPNRKKRVVSVLYHVSADPIPAILKSKKTINMNQFNEYLQELQRRVLSQEQNSRG